jgi:hypothetical protein
LLRPQAVDPQPGVTLCALGLDDLDETSAPQYAQVPAQGGPANRATRSYFASAKLTAPEHLNHLKSSWVPQGNKCARQLINHRVNH